ncbi:MAG: LysE family translocator [Gemmatimonadota bacterium]|jgi:threonine/homoserine/homoserine lactone efflux protein
MTFETSVTFAAAVFLFAATPGPAIVACVARALSGGFGAALSFAAGIVLGDVVFLLFAIYGLAAVATVLDELFLLVRVMGGLYLMWLGWSAWKSDTGLPTADDPPGSSAGHGFRAGLLLTLGNPKVILFYLGFLPAFVNLSELSGRDVAWVVALLVGVLMSVNSAYAWAAAGARGWMRSSAAVRGLNRVAAVVMAAVGAYVVLES